jgi:hypothetical protein
MRRIFLGVVVALGVLSVAHAADVRVDGMTSKPPANWVEEKPANKFRMAQFRVPKAKGDKDDGEIVLFKGLGGGVPNNVKRWKEQFIAPTGKTIDDVSKVEKITIGGNEATQLTIEGTFLYSSAPFAPGAKKEKRPDYKMIAIYYDGKDEEPYQIKFTGPAKTVDENAKAFDAWIKGFKK